MADEREMEDVLREQTRAANLAAIRKALAEAEVKKAEPVRKRAVKPRKVARKATRH